MSQNGEIAAVCEAAVLLGVVSVGLKLAPARATGGVVRRACVDAPVKDSAPARTVNSVVRAVERAARRVPSTCLGQALVGWLMLRRRSVRSVVRLGVARPSGALSAHAWLERDGRILLGADGATNHVGFPPPR